MLYLFRLAAMGGIPALGSLSMSGSELLQHRRALNPTASPAAQEVARLRGSNAPAGLASPGWAVRHLHIAFLGAYSRCCCEVEMRPGAAATFIYWPPTIGARHLSRA